jgi:hypothetical protein
MQEVIIHDRLKIACDGDVDLQLQRMVDAFLYKPFTPGLELQFLLDMQPIHIDCNYCRPINMCYIENCCKQATGTSKCQKHASSLHTQQPYYVVCFSISQLSINVM